ncbi:hypothetical protein CPB85DRAFT_1451669 [Mucidula mucida]|nr:hypothetical protein CPB85DRAFT_1451669 [Mucidula mucida]
MPLEATMMIIDNSEYMRNGDYMPTRFEAQSDAVNTVFQTKIDSNPENTVGVMTMAGKGPEVLVTHSKDLGQILQAIHVTKNKIGGAIDIPTAIAVAQLALKHRENKNLRQRIIVFAGSPLEGPAADEKAMIKLAKKLKKNNVALDVVAFGDGIEEPGEEGKTVLKSFVENTNSGDNSHLLTVTAGTRLISEALMSSPILTADLRSGIPDELMPGAEGPAASGSGANDFEFGVDPVSIRNWLWLYVCQCRRRKHGNRLKLRLRLRLPVLQQRRYHLFQSIRRVKMRRYYKKPLRRRKRLTTSIWMEKTCRWMTTRMKRLLLPGPLK